jgi:hypothetical protein
MVKKKANYVQQQQQWFIDKSNLARRVSGNSCAHIQELQTVQYSLWYVVPSTLLVGDLVTRSPTGSVLGTTYHKLYYTV